MSISEKIKFIESAFGSVKVSPKFDNIAIRCPICAPTNMTKRKLSIRLEDDLNHCWVCGWSSKSLLPLLIKHSDNHHIEIYKKQFYIPKKSSQKNEIEEVKKLELPRDFKLLASIESSYDPDIGMAKKYLYSRGLTDRDLWYFGFGISNEREYKKRIIFPSFDVNGDLNFFTSRTFDSENRIKYVNCDVKKTDVVFNELKLDWKLPVTVVEGPFDITKCNDNTTCLLGSELAESSALMNAILFHSPIINLCLDSDMKQKSQKIAKKLSEYSIDTRIIDLNGFHDPGEMSKEQFIEVLNNAQPWHWNSYIKSKLSHLTSKLAF